ncbi:MULTISPECIES: pyruvate dehydrogenase (acetyl-transferring), homodimeric type [unclassified Halomonas]|uniref:Pyruvate dehydrogenase E1 component n=2 Tax=unclassified Halomonas TaxID=2609666 RepID=A0AAU7KF98_9GAMM|nr:MULTISPECIES: pyruvate dehydrogenase (acetyl-transferring), homodimeric type [unclassified Halomonas]MBR9770621.1 pyruvate dehydrogenase (acetyl-transferring), homodimeric type [Gammaproteobacteria bacterium]MBS8270097.1 pyruvate dehydrogenase (acetyl-transferring), homodimeric type [Halomonas litopenaei]KJZ14408.1 pyruvate dehydrogenase [Halomonas sp. S2151]MAR71499.1 pyruvate dehydrogenase (acetyl-transferring), homodimeric type [Halomonas sp.]MBR9879431.1 pyruvate dehydrogenase (acetyl-t|tara:strand:- start:2299 stop:4971 length:2673 start_codon:yes stop_codon:yes gene_type:complete
MSLGSREDLDPVETQEWLDSLESVLDREGEDRARYLMTRLADRYRQDGMQVPFSVTTPHRNTIPVHCEAPMPGDLFMERRIRSVIRYNAIAQVIRNNKAKPGLGGHIASFMSSATLYDVGFNHFFRAPNGDFEGDLIYIQGHVAPGIYARAYLEGRLTEEQMDSYRQEVDGNGLSSYPHPWLMPEFWQFPTVSMGLGPIQAIYQAHVMKYLHSRELHDMQDRKIWCFMGDGECDEPESLGAIHLASREKLDNLIFVINCNLQRLDGPVRGNSRIIDELEGVFRGAGWNVLKVVWGRHWDPLFEKDKKGMLQKRMDEAVDGDYQNYKANGGAYTREHFFGKYPETADLVKDMSDEDIWKLNRGGHDPFKVYAAYHEATTKPNGRPTVILAHTVKGYGMGGGDGEAANEAHQVKTMEYEALKRFRDRFGIPISDDQLKEVPYYKPDDDSPEMKYMHYQREQLGGYLPSRRNDFEALEIPGLDDKTFASQTGGSKGREVSTTMAFVRILNGLVKDKKIGKRVVPIIPDEARTFGMEGMFRQLGIYTSEGQKYEPVDKGQIMFYREDQKGQILEEGITEAGAMSAWIAAATSYSNNNTTLLPFYIYYSMFGFQRIGDLAWAAGDMQARGFLCGGTAGRTTLNGEGLQHQDGHSLLQAAMIPNCRTYDPTYGHEVAVIVQDGLKRMFSDKENCFYYLTLMNENYEHPELEEIPAEDIIKGMYLLRETKGKKGHVQLLGSGTILREVEAAAEILAEEWGVGSDIWSVTSFNELRREALGLDRQAFINPDADPEKPHVTKCLEGRKGPAIASTDYMKLYADQVRAWVPTDYHVLGTDGYGRSDTREALRRFFEVDRYYVTVAALKALADRDEIDRKVVAEALKKYDIDPNKPNPLEV